MPEGNTIQAEQAVIGSLLIDEKCHNVVFGMLRTSDFVSERNKEIFNATRKLWENHEPADVVTILHDLGSDATTDSLALYARDVMELTPTTANVLAYAKIVKENGQLRNLWKLADDVSEGVMLKQNPVALITNIEQRIEEIGSDSTSPLVSSQDALERWQEWIKEQSGNPEFVLVRTGFDELDAQLGGGFFKTGFYVMGGRPGMGKTTTALNIAEQIALRGKRVLFLSLEMSLEQITAKRLAVLSGVGYNKLYTARLNSIDFDLLEPAQEKMAKSKFDVIADGVSTVQDLMTIVRTQNDIDIVFVDYMGIMEPADEDKQKPRYEQMTNISKNLKALAKKNNVPVIALSQLNRNSLVNKDKRPTLADLRDTGAIEQDADGVILVHRPGYFSEEANQDDIELIVAKNRHGAPGTVVMKWEAVSGRILPTETVTSFGGSAPGVKTPDKTQQSASHYVEVTEYSELPF